jgi:hypothetical protein
MLRILYVVLITMELMLDVFITSRVRRKIIVVYAKYPDFRTHVRGLAKLIKEDAGNIQRELKRQASLCLSAKVIQKFTKRISSSLSLKNFRVLS